MERTIYIKYHWQTDNLVKAYKYHKKSSRFFWLFRLIRYGLGIFNLLFGVFGLFAEYSNNFAIFQLAIGLFLIFSELINNLVYRYRCRQLNYEQRQVEWQVEPNKIIYRMINLTESTFTWELIIGILDTPEGFLLYSQKNLFYFIPKSGFQQPEDVAHFVFMAQDNVKNYQQVK